MKTIKVKNKPNYIGALREIEVGEVRVIKLAGTTYNALLTARGRMRATKEGDFLFQLNDGNTEMTITRLS